MWKLRRKDKLSLIDDYISIYRLMVVYKKHTRDNISSLDRMYNLTLKLKARIEEIIEKKRLNNESYIELKNQLDSCLVDYDKTKIKYNEEKYIETLISIGENLQKFSHI